VINCKIRPVIPRSFLVAMIFSIFCLLVLELAGGTIEVRAQQPVSAPGQPETAPASGLAKASQDVQKAAEAKSAAGESLAAAETAKKKALEADAAAGVALNGSTNVKENVNAQVVLLPRKQAEKVFSKEIARNYAVVQATINNRSKDAAFLLHSIFLDYSKWVLSGMPSSLQGSCPQTQPNSQAPSCAGQVASVESRVIRGELQDASTWTWRNGIIRAAVLVGAVASGIPAFGSKNAIKYVSAYNGQLVPGTQVFWPDGTVPQLNRVSDFGFQTDKVIGKESADVVYAFFPIDRFLTPGMRNIFLNAPALFFAPAQLFVDRHIGKHCRKKPGICLPQSDVDDMKNLMEDLAEIPTACPSREGTNGQPSNQNNGQPTAQGNTQPTGQDSGQQKCTKKTRDEEMLRYLLMQDCSGTDDCRKSMFVKQVINRISLNSIDVFVQGIMTVDVTTVPASITDVTFDKGNDSPDVWNVTDGPVDLEGTIAGRFLTGGVPDFTSIDLPDGKSHKTDEYINPKTSSVVSDESNDTKLRFELQRKKKIPSGSKLHVRVTKYDAKDTKKISGVNSMDFVLPVNYGAEAAPAGDKPSISTVTFDKEGVSATWNTAGSTLTGNIKGTALDGVELTITKLSVPDAKSPDPEQYFDIATLKTEKNDGADLQFTLKLKIAVPTGSTITFQVTKNASTGAEKAQVAEKPYPVNYK